jgi:hypothetical protein
LMDSLMSTPACSFKTKRGESWSLKMLRFRGYWGAGGKVHIVRNQVLMVRKVKRGRMIRNSGSFFGWGGFFGGWRRIQPLKSLVPSVDEVEYGLLSLVS